MTSINDTSLDDLVANFEFLGDWEERFRYLIDLGKNLPPVPEDLMTDENRVHGCQATVYLKEYGANNGTQSIGFHATSDAHIVNGLIAILLMMFSGKTAADILATDPAQTLKQLQLEDHLSPTRRNGLHAMLKRIREIANRYVAN